MASPRRGARNPACTSFFVALFASALLAACSGGSTPGGPCQSNRDCVSGEACVAGTCAPSKTKPQNGCTNDDDCPLDQTCNLATKTCEPIQGVADAGGADATGGLDAAAPEDTGTITAPDASAPEDTGVVVPPDSGVPSDSGVHPDATVPDSGVPLDSGVHPDATVPDSGITTCTIDSDCGPPARVCAGTQCVPGCASGGVSCSGTTPVCSQVTGRCEAAPGPPPCNLDADCGNATQICVNSACVARCDQPAGACTVPNVCNVTSGRCVPGALALGTTCAIDAQCTSGLCLGLTVGTTSYDVCSDPCSATSNCPIGFTCSDVSGMTFCLSAALYNATFNTPAGGACSATTNTCQSGWCNTGTSQCIETCSRTGDCASWGGNCFTYEQSSTSGTTWDNICYVPSTGAANGATCTTNADCRSGVCNRYDGVCAHQCCSEADCATTESCAVYDLNATTPLKICVPRSVPAGPGGFGATCTTTSDCESETCVPVNPADPNSVKKCSTLCCRNADCSVLPTGGICRPFGGAIANTLVGACQPN